MRVEEAIAQQYVPFGCGEYVIQGKSVGTPNTLLNLLKLLNITLNKGIDPNDQKYKAGPVPVSYTHLDVYKRQTSGCGCLPTLW